MADQGDIPTWLFWLGTVGVPLLGVIAIGMMHATMPRRRR